MWYSHQLQLLARPVLLLGIVASEGCGPEVADAPSSDGWTDATAWRLSEPVLDFAEQGDGPAFEFTSIRTALQLEDGRVVATNTSRPPEVRVFNPDGSVDWIAGGEGEGPGEFTAIFWAARGGGDTLIAHDPIQGRSTLLSLASGEVLGIVNLRQPIPGVVPERVAVLGRFDDGTYLGFPNRFFPEDPEALGRLSALVLRTQLDGTIVDTVGHLPWADFVPGEEGRRTMALFDQQAVALPDGDRILHGFGDDFSLQIYGFEGTLEGEFKREYSPREVSESVLAAAEARELERVQGPESDMWRAQIAYRYRRGPRADALPTYQRLLVDAEGHVWAQHFLAPGDSVTTWSVFAPTGPFLGEVETPASLRLLDVGTSRAVGVWTDELDVQTIRVYEVVKP